jgi:hypothetical protein
MTDNNPATTGTMFWCWTEGEPSTFHCRERLHDVRESSPGGLTARQPGFAVTLTDGYIKLQNENALLLAKLDRQRVNAQLALRIIDRVRGWHSPSFYPDETGLCGGCGEQFPCHTRRILEGETNGQHQPGVPSGYHCPDHPGPLDDADDHVCRLRPETCLCVADLGSPWDTTPHRKGTRGCRYAS